MYSDHLNKNWYQWYLVWMINEDGLGSEYELCDTHGDGGGSLCSVIF